MLVDQKMLEMYKPTNETLNTNQSEMLSQQNEHMPPKEETPDLVKLSKKLNTNIKHDNNRMSSIADSDFD